MSEQSEPEQDVRTPNTEGPPATPAEEDAGPDRHSDEESMRGIGGEHREERG
jgi:hypothetical protein